MVVFWTNSLLYAEHECTRTVTCSDGTTIIDTTCTSSYEIIDGHIVDNDADDNGTGDNDDRRHHHHHGHDRDPDPCHYGHGYSVDNNSEVPNVSNEINVSPDTTPPDDPYHLRQGHARNYDPNDPYGLRQKIN